MVVHDRGLASRGWRDVSGLIPGPPPDVNFEIGETGHPSCFDHGRVDRYWITAALAFAREGARVVISGRSDEEGRKLTVELQKLGAEAEFLHSDVRRDDDVRDLVDKAVARFGRLDAAVVRPEPRANPAP